MQYKEDSDQYVAGFDAGNILDGKVEKDPDTGEWVIVDDDGLAFSLQKALEKLQGERVRVTCISMRSMETLQQMLEKSSGTA